MQATTASCQRRVLRNINTMRSILTTHEHTGQQPHLTALTTLYLSLLEANADDSVWGLFAQVAALPFTAQCLKPCCWNQPEMQGENCGIGKCGHRMVNATTTVKLQPLDDWRLQAGRERHAQGVTHWWGDQLAQALGVAHV